MSRAQFSSADEAELRKLEAGVPEIAARAGLKAHLASLAKFGQVVTVRNQKVVRLTSDGQYTVLSDIPPAVKVPKSKSLAASALQTLPLIKKR